MFNRKNDNEYSLFKFLFINALKIRKFEKIKYISPTSLIAICDLFGHVVQCTACRGDKIYRSGIIYCFVHLRYNLYMTKLYNVRH